MIPIYGTDTPNYVKTDNKLYKMYNNQVFDYMSQQLPKDIKELFKWCEHIYVNNPVVVDSIKKLINYPITDLTYKTDSVSIRKDTSEFLESTLNIKQHLINLGIDYFIYGNAFRSIYFPFNRFLECKHCGNQINIEHAKYTYKKHKFILECSNCNIKGVAELVDKKVDSLEDIKLISWNPHLMELMSNPISGKVNYYYSIPTDIKKAIILGDESIINSIPKVFLDAVQTNKYVKFNTNLYHFKVESISGFYTGWGISPLTSVIKHHLYASILRKANEAIGLEHITPLRILFPQANTNDPTVMSSLGEWNRRITDAIDKWRLDPNYIMLAPYPTGVANIGGDAKMLNVTNEIDAITTDMARALGVPMDVLQGTTNINNTSVSLRIMENQLYPYVNQLEDYINWVIKLVNAYYNKNFCYVELTPFKLSDDIMKQQLLTNLIGSAVSKTTVQEILGLDPDTENEKMKQDAIADAKTQMDIQHKQEEMANSISNQVTEEQQAESAGTIPEYNQQKLIANADNIAQQLLSMPYEQRKSYLAQLQNEDYVMYAITKSRMENLRSQMETDAKLQAQEEQ